ncbi:hypothetical protein MS3_00002086 [Schistosoma haematobium]|uniref:Antigen Sm21.7 n=3 Tax=Schistosoma TaxID=6181 RepID=A0A094ZTT8_SCHHA|nr:hypothetical protein MS3_00002086 [Schistosoma haematobium]KAH9596398.1 hypothetical protein MS3_00002086 [Schistosoma haematobium]CAH8484772.1 unnamed protein product [Schistosoma haematobium]CAH8486883.1 unnamed protein product [Schistosoma haematobium]VDP72599.1 unnamed protein product [Schistosoma mattheei]
MDSPMEKFIQIYLTLIRDNDESVETSKLSESCRREKLDMKQVNDWIALFDVDKDQKITFEEFCRGLGLKQNEMRIERNHIKTVQSGREPDLPEGVKIISSTMPKPKQVEVTLLYKDIFDGVKKDPDMNKVVKTFKSELERRYGRVWQVNAVTHSYWASFSHEPFQSIQFQYENKIILAWRTPSN